MTISFNLLPYLRPQDAETLAAVNASLERLRGRREKQIADGDYSSKVAWKLRVYAETVLYRIVALTESFALNWNSENWLGSYLPARALVETAAIILDLEHELERLATERDVPGIDRILMNRTFATRLAKWIEEDSGTQAVNVLTLIDRLDKRLLAGARGHYDRMSERCHPNYLGGHAMFGELDTETGITTFRLDKHREGNIALLMAAVILVLFLERCFNRLDRMVERLAVPHST